MVQDEEVNLESYHVYDNRRYNEASDTGSPVPKLVPLVDVVLTTNQEQDAKGTNQRHLEVTKFVPQVFDRIHTDQGRHEKTNEFDAANEFSTSTFPPARLGDKYLVTQPMETPVNSNHIHQSKENGLGSR